jgi:hypothetical protein
MGDGFFPESPEFDIAWGFRRMTLGIQLWDISKLIALKKTVENLNIQELFCAIDPDGYTVGSRFIEIILMHPWLRRVYEQILVDQSYIDSDEVFNMSSEEGIWHTGESDELFLQAVQKIASEWGGTFVWFLKRFLSSISIRLRFGDIDSTVEPLSESEVLESFISASIADALCLDPPNLDRMHINKQVQDYAIMNWFNLGEEQISAIMEKTFHWFS